MNELTNLDSKATALFDKVSVLIDQTLAEIQRILGIEIKEDKQ